MVPKTPFKSSISKVTRSVSQGVVVNLIAVPHNVHIVAAVK